MKMKMKWKEPRIEVQKFIPNEYVAACYRIKCTTPRDNASYKYIYADSNNNGIWDQSDQQIYSNKLGFRGCNQWHKGVILDEPPTANGFVTTGRNPDGWGVQSESVFYWYENLGHQYEDIHVMTPGNENYESNPNAS